LNALRLGILTAATVFCAPRMAPAQYPGQVAKSAKDAPILRSVAVLEWTGDFSKPKSMRLVPVTLLDNGELQDASIYLSRPIPLALSGGVEYEIQQDGLPLKLFDVHEAGQEMGSWIGHGVLRNLPAAKTQTAEKKIRPIEDENSERPVLLRKHPGGDGADKHPADQAGDKPAAPGDDEDRPKLHKKDSDSGDSSASSSGSTPAAEDPDRPKLHKKSSEEASSDPDSNAAPSAASDPDRPVLRKKDEQASSPDADQPTLKHKKKKEVDEGSVSAWDATDPDRPKLKRGLPEESVKEITPSVIGLPADLQQAVAVSDAKTRPEHPFGYLWADPMDQERMKEKLEAMARDALGLTPPPPPPAPAPKKTSGHRKAAPAPAPEAAPEPAPLVDEHYRVFELTYGAGATLVYSASTEAEDGHQKYITLIAQPDLYGNLRVLEKNLTDNTHLDETPRLRLVDAVDVLADNRGELLFELRGATQRQFALYRIYRGRAEVLFQSAVEQFGSASSN
jgi:hypothetical protein